MKEFFELVILNLKLKLLNLVEQLKILIKFPSFTYWHFNLSAQYLWSGPFSISKLFHKTRGDKEIYVYGETPITTFAHICKYARIKKTDTFFDLGMGRGLGCFWLHKIIGCDVVGVELIPQFVDRANKVKSKLNIHGIEFRKEDMTITDLKEGTVFYIYGNFLPDEVLGVMGSRFDLLKGGTKVITVSFPITDYSDFYRVQDVFKASFPWGDTDVYVSIKQ